MIKKAAGNPVLSNRKGLIIQHYAFSNPFLQFIIFCRGIIHLDSKSLFFLIVSVVFAFFSFFFSLCETCLTSANKYRFQAEAEDGGKSAKLVYFFIRHFDSSLVGILVGNNAVNIGLSFVTTYLFLQAFPSWMGEFYISLIGSVIVTVIVYALGETLPKRLGKRIPDKLAKIVCYPLAFCLILFAPLTLLFYGISKGISFLFPKKEEPELTEEDFNSVLETNEKEGALEENETDLIQAGFDFTDTSVEKVFTPKNKRFSLNLDGRNSKTLLGIISKVPYSRIPRYYKNPDRIVGVLVVKKFLANYYEHPTRTIASILDKPFIVSRNIRRDDVLDGFRSHHTEIALVYEKDRLLGRITTEDVLEELVGTISEKGTKAHEA